MGRPRPVTEERWELYRVLGEPLRLRLLALAAEEELSVGELAELLGESQPNVSRHAKALRTKGLLQVRKQGTRVLLRMVEALLDDPVVRDAHGAGRALVLADGSLGRVPEVVRAREAAARAFFEQSRPEESSGWPSELSAYLAALSPLIASRRLAIDVGTGDGGLLDVLAPVFDRVVAIDRAETQLSGARERVKRRGYAHVELIASDLHDPGLHARIAALGGADVVFASRVLHHAPKPRSAIRSLAALARPGGAVVVVDYQAHNDESMRETQADLWLGFDAAELRGLAESAGLRQPVVKAIPARLCGTGPDGHLDWQVMVARTDATP